MSKIAGSQNGRSFHGDAVALAEELRGKIRGEVRFDSGSRALCAADGSNYREVPIGVVMPPDAEDVTQIILTANRHGAPVLSRGCGTSLAGQCCNVAVVFDMTPPPERRCRVRLSTALQRRRPFRVPRTLLWCSSVLLTLNGTISSVVPANGLPADKQDEVVAHVSVRPAKKENLQSTVTGFGKVQSRPADVVSVDAPHDSIVNKVYVRAGETVKQGSPLAGLSAAAAAQEAYRKAQAAVEFANAKLKRMEFLWSKRVISRQTLEQAQIVVRDAQATLQAQKKIGAEKQQETIDAPISGTVTAVSVSEGDRILQNAKILSLSPAYALAVLLGLEPDDAGKVQLGMSVILSPATGLEVKLSGRVSAINSVIDQQTRLVDVLIDIESGRGNPQPIGTYMRGKIILKRKQALTVPRTAILYRRCCNHWRLRSFPALSCKSLLCFGLCRSPIPDSARSDGRESGQNSNNNEPTPPVHESWGRRFNILRKAPKNVSRLPPAEPRLENPGDVQKFSDGHRKIS